MTKDLSYKFFLTSYQHLFQPDGSLFTFKRFLFLSYRFNNGHYPGQSLRQSLGHSPGYSLGQSFIKCIAINSIIFVATFLF